MYGVCQCELICKVVLLCQSVTLGDCVCGPELGYWHWCLQVTLYEQKSCVAVGPSSSFPFPYVLG